MKNTIELEEDFHYQLSDKEKRIDELKNMKLGNYEDIVKKSQLLLFSNEFYRKKEKMSFYRKSKH